MDRFVPISREELGIFLSCQQPTLAYNLPLWIPLPKGSYETTRKALEEILRCHPALNTRFYSRNGDIVKAIEEQPLQLTQVKGEPADKESLVQPFELLGGPLYRFTYYKGEGKDALFADFHHINMDGFSLTRFLSELSALLEGKKIEAETFTSLDEGEDKEKRRQEKEYADDKEYFSNLFGSLDCDSSLTLDKQEKEVRYEKARVELLNLKDEDVKKALDKHGIRRSAFFLSAFALALGQATFAEEVFFLTVNNGRNEKLKGAYGMFVKTLPFYVDKLDTGSIHDLLARVDKQQKETIAHSSYSYSDLVSDCGVSAEVLFAYQGDYYYHAQIDGQDEDIEVIPVKDGKEKMAIQLFRRNGSYFADLEYRADLYEEESIVNLCKRMEHFALELLSKENIEDIDVTSKEDKDLVASFNIKDLTGYDLEKDFVDYIREWIKKNPSKDALVCGDDHVTFGELGDRSDRLADYLIEKGIKKNQVVSILIGRNTFMGVASLGVLKSGAAYQPLDPGYPDERLSFMIEDADAKLLIVDRALKERIPETYNGPVLFTDEIAGLPRKNLPQPQAEPHDLYIMLYTSGSTGKPKGVQLEHHNLTAFLEWDRRYFEKDENCRASAYASYGFDANMFDLYGALCNGMTLYIIDEEMRLDLKRIDEYLTENKITHAMMTTQVGRQFAEDYDNKSLRFLTVGGEKLVPVDPPKHFTLVNAYGPTECTICVTAFKLDKPYYRVPIGPGFPINHLYVLDKKMRVLPYGVPGYLYVSGPQVGRGYLNRPEENKKAFIENPLEGGDYKKMYYTGDVVRFLSDGTVDFIGRKDGQVKIRGFRIEMSEVEKVIREYPGVKDATVHAFPAPSGGSFLAGYVVGDTQLDLDAIKAFIGERKPYYMVPEAMMQIDKIPLNQNSKVNKRALPVPKREQAEVVPPANHKEEALLNVAKKILGYDEIGVTNDLFESGLTSISSIKFITLASEALNEDITIALLRANPTVRALAGLFAENESGEEEQELLPDYPLTATQQGIYVECLANPSSTIYNIPLLYKLGKKVDLDKLQHAIEKAIDAHPYLKGHLKTDENGVPRVVPQLSDKVNVERIKGHLPEPFKVKPYDLTKGPFYQARIYEDGGDAYLYLDTHHIASDGTSLAVLLEDINAAYKGEEIAKEKRDGFAIALKEEKEATPEKKAEQKAHYASFLEGVDCLSLPRKDYDLPKEAKPCEYDAKLLVDKEKVLSFLRKNNLNLNGFFNAVFAYALASFDGNEDALFTSIYSGRDSSFTSRSITMMVKTLPVYARIDPKGDILPFIKEVSTQLEKSQERTLYPFAEISRDYGVKAEVMFAYQGDGFLPDEIGEDKAEMMPLYSDVVKADFSLDCLEDKDAFRLHYEYPSNLYREETMVYFSRLFNAVIEGFLNGGKLGEIVLLDDKTRVEMEEYNKTDDPKAKGSYLDELDKVVKQYPDKEAIVGIDETLTYQEFDKRINKVARAIAKLGVKADDKVVVMVPRIANAYVAREGVLRAGAAFVPVDPAYPDERILYIREDSGAKAILTTKKLYEEKKATFGDAKFLLLEDIMASESDEPYRVEIDPHSLAYCIYTSGSTGKPKGVMIEHHSLANFVQLTKHNYVAREYAEISHVAISMASLSFDLSIQEEFVPLAHGLTVLIASEDEILNPVAMAKRMKLHGVDILTTTPSYVNNVLDIEDVMVAWRDLKVIDLGAEALPASMMAKMRERGMNAYVHNGYGPTEATVSCIMDRVTSERITIGYPMNNVKTYIVDPLLRRLPFGAVGELLIGGEGVGRGYINRDDLTKEKFIDFEGVYSYRSGDIARINYDGRIEFFGRKDNQVKLRGLRVELDEIENTMLTYDGISHAIVLVKETKEEGQFLVGYYLAKEEIPTEALKEHLGKSLTPYMIPKVFVKIDAVPLTSNGKVNKKALPEPVLGAQKEGKKAIRAPRNDIQKDFLEIFKKVLGLEEISIDDDFFDLGGTSLSASKVTMLALGKGYNVSYSDVFDNPTVIDLAALAGAGSKKAEVKEEKLETAQEGLESNVIAHVDEITQGVTEFDSILLTGATGFLGIHILHELLEHGSSKVLALVRGSRGISGKDRLQGLLEYYFDSPYEEEMAKRVKVIESDVTSSDLLSVLKDEDFGLIVNCAAIVKHFASDDAIERVNLGGVKNLIDVALNHKARLVQISTLSVAGENVDHKFAKTRRIHENEIFFGQDVSNKYINSKIKAEEAIIDGVAHRGLDGKIVRVGNLMGRARDGEFQVNSGTNNFMASIRAYKKLGVFPVSGADATIDFSPIDEVAKTILLLAKTNKKFTLFHSANSHEVEFGDVIAAMNDYGYPIKMVDDETFMKRLNEAMADESIQMDVSCLISYNSSGAEVRELIPSDNTFTIKALYRLGYKWPITDENYLDRSILSLSTLGFFE